MPRHTPYSPGDPIKSSYTNDDIDGLADGSNDTDNNNLQLFRQESFDNYFASGGVWTITTGLTGAMSSGVMYYAGVRIPFSAVGSKVFTASKDTYVDISNANTVHYSEVANGATPPTLAANRIRCAVVVTNATDITTIIQQDRDSSGNLVYNRKPIAQASSAPRMKFITTSASITPDASNTDILAITALAENATFNLPVGSPANGQGMLIRIKDNGTPRTLSWNGVYRPIGLTMPTATVGSKTFYIALRYNGQDNKWDVLSVAREA